MNVRDMAAIMAALQILTATPAIAQPEPKAPVPAASIMDAPLQQSGILARINDRSHREPGTVSNAFRMTAKLGLGAGVAAGLAFVPVPGALAAAGAVAKAFAGVAGWAMGGAVENGIKWGAQRLVHTATAFAR